MDTYRQMELRARLLDRRRRLDSALRDFEETSQISRLLSEVDSALQRMDEGTYGLCEVCHDSVEEDRLMANPLLKNCLDHLTPNQQMELEQDLNLASRIQQQLLPGNDLRIGDWEIYYHYEPAGSVSGDYCDLLMPGTESGDVFFLLGDISGKGVAASMLMAHLHAIFRSLASVKLSANQLVERGNRVFCDSTMSPDYATLICGRAGKSGRLEICNAGHCPAVLVRSGDIATIEASGFPLGIFYDGEYGVEQLQLMPGDILFLYTDGLTEAKNNMDEEFGAERLIKVIQTNYMLSPRDLTELCLEDMKKFLSGLANTDDLTIMVVRRRNVS
jgi:sigma-B regulation protein RsbU (phosphoserine phosphatase)